MVDRKTRTLLYICCTSHSRCRVVFLSSFPPLFQSMRKTRTLLYICCTLHNRCRVAFLSFFPPSFQSSLLVCFHPCLVCILFTGLSLLEMNFRRKCFLLVSVGFWWLKPRNWAMNKVMTILWPPKLPGSLVWSVTVVFLPSKFPPVNKRSLLYFQNDVQHLTLPRSLDLDTACVVHGLQNIKT